MVELKRITSADFADWNRLADLYVTAFPPEERRDVGVLEKLLGAEKTMVFNAIYNDGVLAGFQIYWDFGEFCYLEHFAVFPEMRGGGIGAKVLEIVGEMVSKPLLLEVEPAVDELTRRRVGFYERCGFSVAPVDYVQPSYYGPGDAMPLWIMTKPACTSAQAERWTEIVKAKVYIQWL